MKFSDVLDIRNGRNQRQVENANGKYPIYGSGGVMGRATDFICDAGTVVIGRKGSINNPIFVDEPFWNVDTAFGLVAHRDVLLPKYLFYFCANFDFERLNTTVTIPSLTKANLLQIEINVPDMDEQRHVVSVLDKICRLTDLQQQELHNLDQLVKSRFIELFGDPVSNPKDWNVEPLGNRCGIITGNTPPRSEPENYGKYIEWIKSDNINTPFTFITKAQECLSEAGFEKCRFVEAGSILMTCIAGSIDCIGNVAVTDRRVAFNQQINAIVPEQDEVLYLYWLMQLSKPMIHRTINMALKGILSKSQLSEIVFPFPPITLQEQFAAFVKQTDKSKYYSAIIYRKSGEPYCQSEKRSICIYKIFSRCSIWFPITYRIG